MKLKQYITEGKKRSKPINFTDALTYIKNNCKGALKMFKNGAHGDYIFRGLWSPGQSDALEVQGNIEPRRVSANTTNYYTLLLDNLPSWKQYPSRGQSIICSSAFEKADAYGTVFYVFPVDGAKIGVCPESDIFMSFNKVTKPYAMNAFNKTFQELINAGTGVKYDTEWDGSWSRISNKMKLFDKRYVEDGGEVTFPDVRWGFQENIADTIMDMYKKSRTMKEAMDKLLDPSRNGFKLMKAGQKLPTLNEVWIEEKCILIKQENWTYEELLKL